MTAFVGILGATGSESPWHVTAEGWAERPEPNLVEFQADAGRSYALTPSR